jgi:exodeoxyribonuclease V gamma subunit
LLTIHRSERADRLVSALAEVLAVPLGDPFTPEVVAVPSRGVERWISQTLSTSLGAGPTGSDGVCANVLFPSPSRLVADTIARATGVDPDDDPWAARRLPWTLLEVIDACAGEDWCRTLGVHIGAAGSGDLEHRRGRRVAVAQKLAGLFTSYAAQRPAMVRAWVAGDDGDLEPDLRWQPELFRRLRAHLGGPSPAERLEDACAAMRSSAAVVDLPDRLSLFGPTRLTVDQLLVVDALGEHREVHLWLPHPSHGLWARMADAPAGITTRRDDPSATIPQHPLVSSLGRDTRELQLMLREHTPSAGVMHHPTEVEPTTLLRRLQRDLHEDRPPQADLAPADTDRSVQVHSCHGRLRQVEVMREVLLGLLEDDPSLELRDVVVMCPDIESFAPLISATFGLVDEQEQGGHPAHRLRVRLADRSLRQTNPVLSVLGRLLDFVDARVTVSEVLDFAALGPVRRRFGFDDEALERLGDWVRRAGVRWGLDAAARSPYRLEGVPHNTWASGLDRLLVGVTMDEDDLRTYAGVLPLDDVDSGEIDLAGRLAELLERIAAVVESLSGRRPLVGWVEALEAGLEGLADVPMRDGWQVTQARAQLAAAVEAAGDRATSVPLGLADVRSLLAERLQGRPTRANFRTGHLTMCSMVPMRSVPHRVVFLLGLDDQAFPRNAYLDGDSVLARRPLVGERDARTEDRQLFLDAILAAEETLVMLYSGHDERTGASRPPAVPLGELLDVLDRTAAGNVRGRVLVQHPLQPFDPRNFEPGRLVAEQPFSFDPAAVEGARALVGGRVDRPEFVSSPLAPAQAVTTVALDELAAFLEHPVKAFLRQRLGLTFVSDDTESVDALSVELDGLTGWQIGNRLLQAGLAGEDYAASVAAEIARGDLPPGPLGKAALDPIVASVLALVDRSAGLRAGNPASIDVDVTLQSGVRLLGTVANVYGECAVRIEYSKLKPKHVLVGWLSALALVANDPRTPWRSMVAGRADRGGIAYSHVGGLTAEQATAELDSLVGLYLLGMTEPLPLTEQASSTYAERRDKGAPPSDATAKAEATWKKTSGAGSAYGEHADAAHLCVWGEAEFSALLAQPAEPAEAAPGLEAEPHRFGTLARRLWQPLLSTAQRG